MIYTEDYLANFQDFNNSHQSKDDIIDKQDFNLKLICRNLFYNLYMKEELTKYPQIFKSILNKHNIWGVLSFFIEKFIQEGTKIPESSLIKFKYFFKIMFSILIKYYVNKEFKESDFTENLYECLYFNHMVFKFFLNSLTSDELFLNNLKSIMSGISKVFEDLIKNNDHYQVLIKKDFINYFLAKYNETLRFSTQDFKFKDNNKENLDQVIKGSCIEKLKNSMMSIKTLMEIFSNKIFENISLLLKNFAISNQFEKLWNNNKDNEDKEKENKDRGNIKSTKTAVVVDTKNDNRNNRRTSKEVKEVNAPDAVTAVVAINNKNAKSVRTTTEFNLNEEETAKEPETSKFLGKKKNRNSKLAKVVHNISSHKISRVSEKNEQAEENVSKKIDFTKASNNISPNKNTKTRSSEVKNLKTESLLKSNRSNRSIGKTREINKSNNKIDLKTPVKPASISKINAKSPSAKKLLNFSSNKKTKSIQSPYPKLKIDKLNESLEMVMENVVEEQIVSPVKSKSITESPRKSRSTIKTPVKTPALTKSPTRAASSNKDLSPSKSPTKSMSNKALSPAKSPAKTPLESVKSPLKSPLKSCLKSVENTPEKSLSRSTSSSKKQTIEINTSVEKGRLNTPRSSSSKSNKKVTPEKSTKEIKNSTPRSSTRLNNVPTDIFNSDYQPSPLKFPLPTFKSPISAKAEKHVQFGKLEGKSLYSDTRKTTDTKFQKCISKVSAFSPEKKFDSTTSLNNSINLNSSLNNNNLSSFSRDTKPKSPTAITPLDKFKRFNKSVFSNRGNKQLLLSKADRKASFKTAGAYQPSKFKISPEKDEKIRTPTKFKINNRIHDSAQEDADPDTSLLGHKKKRNVSFIEEMSHIKGKLYF